MPSKPLPESSFADLYEPDYDGGLVPSHSQTPQMAARMAAARQAAIQAKKTRSDHRAESSNAANAAGKYGQTGFQGR